MAASRATAAHASVVFLKIPEYAQTPVAEQVRLKDRLEGRLAAALAGIAEARRIVLEAADGAAIVVLGDPVAALRVARRSSAGEGLHVAAGVSYGPVRVAEGGNTPLVLGDAITVADAVAGFATPGRVAATREFRDALVRASPSYAWYLAPAGTHSDARERSHEVFLADERTAAGRRRHLALAVAAIAAVIVGLGFAARLLVDEPRPAQASSPAQAPANAAPARAAEPARVREPAAPAPSAAAAAPPAGPALATLKLDIKPSGEVLVDGVAKGRSPPLVSLQVATGKHRIEVRRPGSSAVVLHVDAGPGEQLTIKHTFAAPPPKSAWRKFFDQFK